MEEMKYCQSCAMPLTQDAQHGSNQDGSKSEEYCSYCYQKGAFTNEVTMEEMIEICVGPMVEENKDLKEEQARQMMQQYFPTLKRWQNH